MLLHEMEKNTQTNPTRESRSERQHQTPFTPDKYKRIPNTPNYKAAPRPNCFASPQ